MIYNTHTICTAISFIWVYDSVRPQRFFICKKIDEHEQAIAFNYLMWKSEGYLKETFTFWMLGYLMLKSKNMSYAKSVTIQLHF